MEKHELLRRAEDLCERCERTASVTHTGFLSPAERVQVESWSRGRRDCRLLFHGGGKDCERRVGFFLPDWLDEESFDPSDYLCALCLTAPFGSPGHRDYLGAVLGMGVGRDWVGDIRVEEERAYLFCLQSVQKHLLGIEKVGRCAVKAEALQLAEVPEPRRQVEERSFSVQSLRLDAVVGGMFHLSRTEAARRISAGNVSLNYVESLETDSAVQAGDVKCKSKCRIN